MKQILGVLLVIGILADKSSAIKCYSCMYPLDLNCISTNSYTQVIDCSYLPYGVCIHTTSNGKKFWINSTKKCTKTNFSVGGSTSINRHCGMQGFCNRPTSFGSCNECENDYCNSQSSSTDYNSALNLKYNSLLLILIFFGHFATRKNLWINFKILEK